MKRIVVCCDGTWNEPDHNEQGKPCPTNVVKLASLIPAMAEDGTAQRVFADYFVHAKRLRGHRITAQPGDVGIAPVPGQQA